jgi:small-conductance mechanosensitive channel
MNGNLFVKALQEQRNAALDAAAALAADLEEARQRIAELEKPPAQPSPPTAA